MPRKRQQEIEAHAHPDGFQEGVMHDDTGVQIGMAHDPDRPIHPEEIAHIRKTAIKNNVPNKKDGGT